MIAIAIAVVLLVPSCAVKRITLLNSKLVMISGPVLKSVVLGTMLETMLVKENGLVYRIVHTWVGVILGTGLVMDVLESLVLVMLVLEWITSGVAGTTYKPYVYTTVSSLMLLHY